MRIVTRAVNRAGKNDLEQRCASCHFHRTARVSQDCKVHANRIYYNVVSLAVRRYWRRYYLPRSRSHLSLSLSLLLCARARSKIYVYLYH